MSCNLRRRDNFGHEDEKERGVTTEQGIRIRGLEYNKGNEEIDALKQEGIRRKGLSTYMPKVHVMGVVAHAAKSWSTRA